jgi:hypothetical protein
MDIPHAAPLLTFFAVHETITDETLDEAAALRAAHLSLSPLVFTAMLVLVVGALV